MYVVRMPCDSHAGSCGQKQSRAKGRSLRWPQGHPPAAPLLGWRGDGVPRAEPSQAGRRQMAACARRQFDRYSRSRKTAMPRIPVSDEALRRRRPPRAGDADRACSKLFKAVQSGSKFKVRAFKVCSSLFESLPAGGSGMPPFLGFPRKTSNAAAQCGSAATMT
jgi:hypothetical protein